MGYQAISRQARRKDRNAANLIGSCEAGVQFGELVMGLLEQ